MKGIPILFLAGFCSIAAVCGQVGGALLSPKALADKILLAGGKVGVSVAGGPTVYLESGKPWPSGAAEVVIIDHPNAESITDADMASLGALRKLRQLHLVRSQITGASFAHLTGLSELSFLDLFQTAALDDTGWEFVAQLPALTTLAIAWTKMTDAGVAKLAPLKGLTWLNIDHTLITDAGITVLTNFPNLHFLNLDTVAITDKGFETVATLSKLQTLILVKTGITDKSVPLLARMKSLVDLNIRDTLLSPAAAQYLQGVLLLTRVTPSGPVITQGPASLVRDPGATALFTVAALGTPPLQLQWFFGTTLLVGETNAQLLLRTVTPGHAGVYSVDIRNAYGLASSAKATLVVRNPTPPAVAPKLLAEFNFNEGGGSTVATVDGGLLGTFTGSPVFSSDSPSGLSGDFSIQFEPGQRIQVQDPRSQAALGTNNSSFTIEAWLKFTTPRSRAVFFYDDRAVGVSASVFTNRTAFVTTLGIADVASAADIPDDGGWHHVAIVHDAAKELRFYVDGRLGATLPYTQGVRFDPTNHHQSFWLGAESDGFLQYVGWMDRFRYWSGVVAPGDLDFTPIPRTPPGVGVLRLRSAIAGRNLELSWPTNGPAVALEMADALRSGNWVRLPTVPTVATTNYIVTVPFEGVARFYRLAAP